jgi:hypothetical protein
VRIPPAAQLRFALGGVPMFSFVGRNPCGFDIIVVAQRRQWIPAFAGMTRRKIGDMCVAVGVLKIDRQASGGCLKSHKVDCHTDDSGLSTLIS